MSGNYSARSVLGAALLVVVLSQSFATAQSGPILPVAPEAAEQPVASVPFALSADDTPPAGTAKPGDFAKLYDQNLTCERHPVRFANLGSPKHKGCFQKATLFEWSIGCDPRKNGEDEEETSREERLASDRPDFTEASSTVGRGRVQLESGYSYFGDNRNGIRTIRHGYPEALFRIGMFADWFELRIYQSFFSESVTENGVRTRVNGAEDLYLGCKIALTKQKGVMPETAIIFQGTVPSGHRAFTNNRALYGFNYLFGWDVTDFITFGGSFQANKAVDETGLSYALFAQSLTIGYNLTEDLTAYTEWFALYPSGAADTRSGAQHYYNGGFQYFITNNFALDVRIGVGLSRNADDFFTGGGFVVRY